MKIGIVGYQGSGKSSLFEWLTGVPPDPGRAHLDQLAMAEVPDERLDRLCEIYHPKKVVHAFIELVDTPGLRRTHEGSAAALARIREVGCLILVVAAYDGSNPAADVESFEEDLLLADLEILSGRVDRLRESVKRPRPTRDQEILELAALEPLVAAVEEGTSLHEIELNDEQLRATRSFGLLTEKPRLIVVNLADDEENPQQFVEPLAKYGPAIAAPVGLELELARLSEEDRAELIAEMDIELADRSGLLRTILDISGQMLFFTASEKEARTWLIDQASTAQEAAGSIHTDLARGFIRAEVMNCDDLFRLGSEREVKAQRLMRQEPKDYVVQEGDILHVKFSV